MIVRLPFGASAWRARLSLLRSCERAVALIEFAIALPVLVILMAGGMELTHYVLVQMQVNRIAAMAADSASRLRTPMTESYMNQLFTGVKEAGEHIAFVDHGRVIVSSVQNNNAATGQWIRWQRCTGSLSVASKYGVQDTGKNDSSLSGINGVKASSGSAMIYAEAYYDYQPIMFGSLFKSKRIVHEAAFVVRQRTDFSISGSSPSTC